jgi:lysophospholipase L1-like esterase
MRTYAFGEPGDCGGVDNQDCIQEVFSIYRTDTEEIIAEIISLRRPSEALIRIMDTWQLKVSETKETGSFEMYNAYWREANAHIVEVATSYGIPVARIFDAFMGEGGVEDPRDLGYVGSDGLHPIQDGIDLMAEIFRNLGYDYALDSP